MKNMKKKYARGFTLIEVLVVIGIIAVLSAAVLVAVNPARQFAQARNSQRTSNVAAILNAIGQNIADNRGTFVCSAGKIPENITGLNSSMSGYDIRPCLVPTYLPELPVDPESGVMEAANDYDTRYTIVQNATTKRVTIAVEDDELDQEISSTR